MLKAVTEVFGLQQGEELYQSIADSFGPGVKGAVMLAMLTGGTSFTVTIYDASKVTQYVELIKTVRKFTGAGLKEARDWCDLARIRKAVEVPTIGGVDRAAFIRELSMHGASAS